MSAKLPIIKEPHPQPLRACGEGRQSTALALWSYSGLISNQTDIILFQHYAGLAKTDALMITATAAANKRGGASQGAFPASGWEREKGYSRLAFSLS